MVDSTYTITGTDQLVYTDGIISLTADISNTSISVTADNITLNGADYILTNTTLVLTNCNNITVTGWTITETETAVVIAGGTNITFTQNTLSQNKVGLYLTNKIAENTVPLNVTVYQNNFYNNLDTKFDLTYSTQTQVTFTNSTHGNFWYTYAGADTDLNGVGDTPYQLTADFTDPNPLMSPVGEPLIVVPEFPTYILLITICCTAAAFVVTKKLEVKKQ